MISRFLQYLRLVYLRIAGPLQRFAVTLRYEGAGATIRAVWEALRSTSLVNVPGTLRPTSASNALSVPLRPRTPPVERPLVSIVVRTFNRPRLLTYALADLARQTYGSLEILIVNDGGASVTDAVQAFESDSRFRLVAHEPGSGRSAALNSGLKAARGELITYLDDDDRVYPEHVATLVSGFDGGVDVVYTNAARVLCWSDLREDRPLDILPCISKEFDQQDLLIDNWIPLMTFMHRRSCIELVGRFDPELDLFEDWDFLIRLGQTCLFRHLPVTTCEYRYRFGPMAEHARSVLRTRTRVLDATRAIYDRYPVADAESRARRSLTLQALRRDVHEVGWIEETTADPVLRDLLTAAWVGRFPRPERHAQAAAGYQTTLMS